MSTRTPSDLDKLLGEFLQAEMDKREMSYAKFAKFLGISKSTCQRLMQCDSSATLQLLAKIRRKLRVSTADIFQGK